MTPKKDTQKSVKSTTTTNKKSKGFTAEEKAAMKERAKELKAEERAKKHRAAGESDVLAKIAETQEPDRAMTKRLHAIIKASATTCPALPGSITGGPTKTSAVETGVWRVDAVPVEIGLRCNSWAVDVIGGKSETSLVAVGCTPLRAVTAISKFIAGNLNSYRFWVIIRGADPHRFLNNFCLIRNG